MRFLNKVVFINSATIRYADVLADGNVHLIGTQGVGKSTLLRAILFFYNADTLKLGISREKKSFAEYYFPFQNSYLIYEVMRETGPYCIIAFKSQGKVCFRFLDTAYDVKYFVSAEGRAFEKWEETRQLLDAAKIDYTRKIDRYEEYRDIVYGNNDTGKKEFGKYALLQSKQYKNIPRTIQNVFLNSKLEAEFIKQTIIMSLNEEDLTIDLQSYTHHLKNFEEQLADIHQYKLPSVQKQAESVVKFHLAIRFLEREKNQFSQQLAWSANNIVRTIPKLTDKREKAETEKQLLQEKVENAETRFRNKAEKIRGEISVLENDLKKAKEKAEYYLRQNIDEIIIRVGKKSSLETEATQLNKEKEMLTAQFSSVSQKYETLLQTLETNLKAFEQEKAGQRLQLREQSAQEKDAARKWLDIVVNETRNNNKQAVQQAREALDLQQQQLQKEFIRKEATKHQRFFEDEIVETQQNISDLLLSTQQAEQQNKHLKNKIETLTKQWELDETATKQAQERQVEKLQENISSHQAQMNDITGKLERSEKALYGWLNQNQPGWEETIGKVCSEEVLFSHDLAPEKAAAAGSFYGVNINLEEVNVRVKTLAEYETEKAQLVKSIAKLQKQLQTLQQEETDKLDKIRKKYQPLIKEAKDSGMELTYKLEQETNHLEQAKLHKKDLEIKASDASREALAKVDEAIFAAQDMLLQLQEALNATEQEVNKQVKAKEREHDRKITAIETLLKTNIVQIDKAIIDNKQAYQTQKEEVTIRQQDELAGNGVDTTRTAAIAERLQTVATELTYIERMRDVVTEYKKDKRELIDKADEAKNKKVLLEQQYGNETEKHRLQKANFMAEIAAVDDAALQIKGQLIQAEEDHKAFEQFRVTDAYLTIEAAYKEVKDLHKTEKRSKTLIDDINRNYYNGIKRLDDLKDATNKFLGNFSPQNIFNFTTGLVHKTEYQQFAEQLNEFVSNSKIEEFEKRVNERFATIIHSLGKETGILMSKGGEIQSVINNINKDFDNKNFVGAIKKIELRLDESANKVVQLLLHIKRFNDEHSFDIGGMNLFSSIDSDAKNRKAVDLLKQLGKAITEYKKDVIALSDSFELKFRIEENQNDTGWVEKLSNVGSEGTDVLVKAMINIMLLNVFKEGASKRFKDFRLHCMMDEIGKLHPNNVKGILQFANDRNILLINGSPTETNALDYRHIYKLEKDSGRFTKIKRIISNYAAN